MKDRALRYVTHRPKSGGGLVVAVPLTIAMAAICLALRRRGL